VLVDGALAGKTPLPTPLAIAPGAHTLAVRRAGYRSAERALNVGEGTAGNVSLPLTVDRGQLSREGGWLTLTFSERDAVVFIDGEPRGAYAAPIELPRGRHRLRVERAEFFAFERDVSVERGARSAIRVELLPTPEKRAAYRSHAVAQRTWAWIGVGAGAALAGAGSAFLLWNQGQKNDAQAKYDEAFQRYSSGPCNPSRDEIERRANGCTEGTVEVDIRFDSLDSARKRDVWGWAGVGVGAASLTAGLVLHAIRDDPDRYEPRAESDLFARASVTPVPWGDRRGAGLSLIGSF
jgi:hypothetical protein